MKKTLTLMAFAASASALAGGLLTNTNQNAAFLRNFAQEGQISLTSLYANPAGNAFLAPGWHFNVNSQTAVQQRNITTTFPLFALNEQTPGMQTHEYKGKAFAPVVPSFSVSHNWDRWSLSAHFALTGGGGKCEFDDGLGSFEALYGGKLAQGIISKIANNFATAAGPTLIPQYMGSGMTHEQATAALAADAEKYGKQQFGNAPQQYLQAYKMDSYMKGRSYYFGLQLGGAYKITDYISAYIGIRGVYATCSYSGYVKDFQAAMGGQPMQNLDQDLFLDCDQKGFGVTPIFGLDWKINNQWNVAIKYEANTRMSLKNSTKMNEMAEMQANDASSPLAKFKDGAKVREDIPAILAMGAEYSPISKVRIDGGFKMYFDKTARKENNGEDLINKNTWELTLGTEYDINKWITMSGSWQRTCYGLSDAYMNDLSFNLSSHSMGLGVRINATERLSFDLGYMRTFYSDRTVKSSTALGDKTDTYKRKNDVVGIGVNFSL